MMSEIKKLSLLVLINMVAATSAYAARIVDTANQKAVNNVQWNKIKNIDAKQILAKEIPNNTASIFFLRRADQDTLKTSANIAINDRFQVSLQPGNYSQVYSCVGVNEISAEITGHKNNDLLKNHTSFKLEPNTTYFFDIDVDTNGNAIVNQITNDSALENLKDMQYQTHQITRVVANCPQASIPIAISAPQVVAPQPIQYESIELKILFDNDKSIVKPQYYDEVKRVADFMTRHPEVTATLEGHTDSNASADYNLALSQRRVDAVKQILIQNYNIDASRLNSIGYGESHPIADNATAEGRQRNRRVIAVFKTN